MRTPAWARFLSFVSLAAAPFALPAESPPSAPPLPVTTLWQWGPVATSFSSSTDVWNAPASARLFDTTGDGVVNRQDDPSLVLISGNSVHIVTGQGVPCGQSGTTPSACHTGVLRVLDGRTGAEQYSLDKASPDSSGFAGIAVALGDVLRNGTTQIVAVTGEGYVVLVGSTSSPPVAGSMTVLRTSDQPLPGASDTRFGSAGALALGDMDADGTLAIAFGSTVYDTTDDAITLRFTGISGSGGTHPFTAVSVLADLDGQPGLELAAGRTAYRGDGSIFWDRAGLADGFAAVADVDGNGWPEVVLVSSGDVLVLEGTTGMTLHGPLTAPGTGAGGPPVLADFDHDLAPEIGVAKSDRYSVLEPDPLAAVTWQTETHDYSSSTTGSVAFAFEGDHVSDVVYGDECFLWVMDGASGGVRLGLSHTSFTATEMPIVADVDGDSRAELVLASTGADPYLFGCENAVGDPITINGVTWQPSGSASGAYRGVVVYNAASGEWANASALWDEHTFRADATSFRRGGADFLPFLDGFELGDLLGWDAAVP